MSASKEEENGKNLNRRNDAKIKETNRQARSENTKLMTEERKREKYKSVKRKEERKLLTITIIRN